jgi:pimeloyl-ACP methyl ester carboxylesterase
MERVIVGGSTAERRDALANIVFVHGIGSSGETAWKSSESKEPGAFPNWLWEDLERQTAAPINVWVASYPAEVFRLLFYSLDRDDSVPQRGRMLRDLVLDRIADRPVIFIAHSLGGIMVKQMLRAAMDMRHQPGIGPFNLALSTKLVVFLATPHAGSSMANLAMALPAFAGTVVQSLLGMVDWLPMSWPFKVVLTPLAKVAVKTGPFTNSLRRDDAHLEDLAAWYRHNAVPLGIETRAYHENLKYAIRAGRFKGRTLMVVEKASANPGVSGCDVVPLEGDHGTVCKPTSRTDPNYTVVLNAVKAVVDHRCPAFAQTHQAIFDAGETFVRLTELKNTADRLVKTKVVVHPIEKVLGRDAASVEYETSFGTRGGFRPGMRPESCGNCFEGVTAC